MFVHAKCWSTEKLPLCSQINWGHPLSQGLVGCWLMNEGGGKMKDYYEVRVHCSNCGFKGKIQILREHLVDNERCPECNCTRLVAVDAHKRKRITQPKPIKIKE